jgi:hypothetical protein
MANGQTAELEEDQEGTTTEVTSSVLESLTRGEIDAQVRTAKVYPRSIKAFLNESRDMACLDEETAASCIYALPRGGKPIEGPSARLAEIVASAWGNCRAGARVVSEDERFVTAQGFFFDVQRNYAVAFEVRRRITDKRGNRYNDDMVGVTSNAACSIALRNAVFKGVPKAFWGRVYEAARKTAVGDAKTLEARRADLLAYFGKMGVTTDRILAAIDCPSVEDIGADELVTLRGVATAIREGDTSIEQAFPSSASGRTGAVKLDDVMGAKAEESAKKEEPSTNEVLDRIKVLIQTANADLYKGAGLDTLKKVNDGVDNLKGLALVQLTALEKRFEEELEAALRAKSAKKSPKPGTGKKGQGDLAMD